MLLAPDIIVSAKTFDTASRLHQINGRYINAMSSYGIVEHSIRKLDANIFSIAIFRQQLLLLYWFETIRTFRPVAYCSWSRNNNWVKPLPNIT